MLLGLDPERLQLRDVLQGRRRSQLRQGREVDQRLREFCAARTALDVETTLNKAQIGCSRVFGVEDQYRDEHYRAREMTVPVVDHQSGVPIRVYGVVPKMSLTPGRIWRGAPSIGEDTTDILTNMLGLTEPQIATLYNDHVVHRTEPFTTAQVDRRPPLTRIPTCRSARVPGRIARDATCSW